MVLAEGRYEAMSVTGQKKHTPVNLSKPRKLSPTIDSCIKVLLLLSSGGQSARRAPSDRYMCHDRERSRVLTCGDGRNDRCHVRFVMAFF